MSNKITLNIVEPGSPAPAPVTPNTGLFTNGIGSTEATVLGIALVALLAIVSIYIYISIGSTNKQNSLVC